MTKPSSGEKTGHLRHGLSFVRKCPSQVFEFVQSKTQHFQNLLEKMVMAKSGAKGLTMSEACLVQSAMRSEQRAQLAQLLLAKDGELEMAKHTAAGKEKGERILTDVAFLNRTARYATMVESATRHRDAYLKALGVADIGLLSLGGEDDEDRDEEKNGS